MTMGEKGGRYRCYETALLLLLLQGLGLKIQHMMIWCYS